MWSRPGLHLGQRHEFCFEFVSKYNRNIIFNLNRTFFYRKLLLIRFGENVLGYNTIIDIIILLYQLDHKHSHLLSNSTDRLLSWNFSGLLLVKRYILCHIWNSFIWGGGGNQDVVLIPRWLISWIFFLKLFYFRNTII